MCFTAEEDRGIQMKVRTEFWEFLMDIKQETGLCVYGFKQTLDLINKGENGFYTANYIQTDVLQVH